MKTELRIERGDATLAASYSPAGETAIVALHGAGEGTREGLPYEHLHEVLPPGRHARRADDVHDGTLAHEYERTLVSWLKERSVDGG